MRILFTALSYGRGHAATSQLITELCEDLARDNQVSVITSSPYPFASKSYDLQGVCVNYVGGAFLHKICNRYVKELILFLSICRFCLKYESRFDIVVCSDIPRFLSLVFCLFRPWKFGRVVYWCMDLPLEQIVRRKNKTSPLLYLAWTLNRIFLWSLRKVDAVVVVGDCMRNFLANSGVKQNSLYIIRPWSEDALRGGRMPAQEARRIYGLEEKFTFLYSGYAGVWHDFETIVNGIEGVAEELPVQFVFAGSGPGFKRVSKCSSAKVRILNPVPRLELGTFLSCGDVHLVSLDASMIGTCVPSKAYTAFALGRPILFIGPDLCQVASDASNNFSGLVVSNSKDFILAVEKMISDKNIFITLSKNALKSFDKIFTEKIALDEWKRILHIILENRNC